MRPARETRTLRTKTREGCGTRQRWPKWRAFCGTTENSPGRSPGLGGRIIPNLAAAGRSGAERQNQCIGLKITMQLFCPDREHRLSSDIFPDTQKKRSVPARIGAALPAFGRAV